MISGMSRAHARARVKLILREQMAKFSEAEIWTAVSLAAKKLGYPHLRTEQKRVLKEFINGSDVFVSLPTGSGKSLCYGVLPATFDTLRGVGNSIAVVVSPLLALMKDQVRSFERKGVKAVYYGEADSETRGDISQGAYQIVFVSPESLLKDTEWRDILQSPIYQENLICVAIDEAHCVKKWQVQDYFCVLSIYSPHILYFSGGRHSGQSLPGLESYGA